MLPIARFFRVAVDRRRKVGEPAHQHAEYVRYSSASISRIAEPKEDHVTSRRVACSCGQLSLDRRSSQCVSMCHCLECQRRTGAVISNQARFAREQIDLRRQVHGVDAQGDSGNALTFHFCPVCGSTVYWTGEGFPGFVAVAIGTFADPDFPAPTIAVWEEARHPWVALPPDVPPKRAPKQG